MREIDEMKGLRSEYLELVRTYGKEATGFKAVRQLLLDLNRRHRLEGKRLYEREISRIEKKVGKRK